MISLKIIDVKTFMSKLLISNVFDNFLLSEMDIKTFNHFHIHGKLNKDFYNNDELELIGERMYSTWKEIKPFAYAAIKGNKLPLLIKIVFVLSNENMKKVIEQSGVSLKEEDVNGLFINVRYENDELYVVTGTSIKTFTLDKTLDLAWDRYVKLFFKQNDIAVE